MDKCADFDQHKSDYGLGYRLMPRDISFDAACRMNVPSQMGLVALTPTEWAMKDQLCYRLGGQHFHKDRPLPYDYLMAWDPETRAGILNKHLQERGGSTPWIVRGYDDKARAVLTQQYAVVNSSDVITKVQKILEASPVVNKSVRVLPESTVTPDSLHLKCIFREWKPEDGRDGGGGNYAHGFYVGNGEIGNRRLRGSILIKRGSCDNTTIYSPFHNPYEAVHRGDPRLILGKLVNFIAYAMQVGEQMIERVLEMESEEVDDMDKLVGMLQKKYGWADETKDHVLMGTEGQATVMGVINGITWAAKSLRDPDARVDMEETAGAILVGEDSLFGRVRHMSELATML
jgi:hypothetical protein